MSATTSRRRASAYVVSITPFADTGAIDEGAFRLHLRRVAAAGIGVYVGGGGSGEGYALSRDDNARLFAIAVNELKGKVPVRAMGVEPRNAAQMIDMLALAESAGMDAAQIYSLDVGHGHAPTPGEIETYFREVLAETGLPVTLSTHQSVGYRIPAELMVELAMANSHVVGINCTHPDLGYLGAIVDGVAGAKEIHVGGPAQALTALALGAQGYLCSEGNLAPRLCASVIDRWEAGDLTGVAQAFAKLIRLSTALYANGGIRVTKAVLNRLALPGGYPRKPRLPAEDTKLAAALALVDRLGISELEGW